MKKKLLVVDLSTNCEIIKKDVDYIKLNKGDISLFNSKRIYLKNFLNKNKKKLKKDFLNFLILSFKNNMLTKNNFITHEIFNLRNDKTNFFDKIFTILVIKKLTQKYRFIEVITDDLDSIDTYKSLNFKITIIKKDIFN